MRRAASLARRDRQADDDIVGAGEPMQEDRRRRGHDTSKVCSAASSQCSQRIFARARQIRRCSQEVRRPDGRDGR